MFKIYSRIWLFKWLYKRQFPWTKSNICRFTSNNHQYYHQTWHFSCITGFIFDPTGQSKSDANSFIFENGPWIKNWLIIYQNKDSTNLNSELGRRMYSCCDQLFKTFWSVFWAPNIGCTDPEELLWRVGKSWQLFFRPIFGDPGGWHFTL